MKIGRTLIEFRRVGGHSLQDEVLEVVTDREGVIRQIIAKVARAAAKDYLDDIREKAKADIEKSVAEFSHQMKTPSEKEQSQ